MKDMKVTESILYVGCNDRDIDLFESQYHVPNGVSYNSYVIMDEKIAVMDTTDPRVTEEWLSNVAEVLGDREPDYLVIDHMEPDHAGNIEKLAERYPKMKLVSNAKVFTMLPQFFDYALTMTGTENVLARLLLDGLRQGGGDQSCLHFHCGEMRPCFVIHVIIRK